MKVTMYDFQHNTYANINLSTVGLRVIYLLENVYNHDYWVKQILNSCEDSKKINQFQVAMEYHDAHIWDKQFFFRILSHFYVGSMVRS